MSERLGTTEFKDRIFDFESSGDWQYKGGLPCVIDFWAEWCPPCKMIAPLLEELAVEYSGRVRFYNVNSDEEPDLAAAFGVFSVPTLLYVPMTGEPRPYVGARPKAALKHLIESELLSEQVGT